MTPTYQSGFYAPGRGTAKYPELWRGCVGAWSPSLGQSGLVLRDWSGNSNHGTLTNGPTWGVSGGRQAISASGGTQYVSASSSPLVGATQISMAAWVRLNSTYGIVSFCNSTNGFIWYVGLSTAVGQRVYTGGSSFPGLNDTTPFTANTWVHVAWVNDGFSVRFFLNGKHTSTVAYTSTLVFAGAWSMLGYGGSETLDGSLVDLRAYRAALSGEAIRLLATRPGIAYELAPRKSYFLPPTSTPHIQYFSGSAARNGSIITGASPLGIVSKVQKSGNLITIPEDRFDDPKYYRS